MLRSKIDGLIVRPSIAFMKMSKKHGDYTISVEGQLIYTSLNGSFNEYGVSCWITAIKSTIAQFNGQAFTMLVNELNAQGATPEALNVANEYNEWLSTQNMKAKAVVYSSDTLKDIDEKRLPSRKKQNVRFFSSIADARQWLITF